MRALFLALAMAAGASTQLPPLQPAVVGGLPSIDCTGPSAPCSAASLTTSGTVTGNSGVFTNTVRATVLDGGVAFAGTGTITASDTIISTLTDAGMQLSLNGTTGTLGIKRGGTGGADLQIHTAGNNAISFVNSSGNISSPYGMGFTGGASLITFDTSSGNPAIRLNTSGARLDLGAGSTDYLASDSTSVFQGTNALVVGGTQGIADAGTHAATMLAQCDVKALSAGTATFTYPTAYTSAPHCFCSDRNGSVLACSTGQPSLTAVAVFGTTTNVVSICCFGQR